MPDTWTFHSAGKLVFGNGALDQAGEIIGRLGAKRILLVTDGVLVQSGLVDRLCDILQRAGLETKVFSGGEPEPSFRAANQCIEMAQHYGPDALLGLGGGSNMDLAKATSIVLANGGRLADYVGEEKIPGSVGTLVCVPTTAGTGSEVSAAAVLTDHEKQIKVGILSNYLRPKAAIVDPLLTRSCPPKLTADSGIDALTHAIEAYTAIDNEQFLISPGERTTYQGRHPLGDCLAEKAIRLIGANLVQAVRDGSDSARQAMSLGATLAGLAFSNVGVALVHALEYPLGGAVHCSHGAGNGLLLPYVMRFNLPARQKAFADIAGFLGENTVGMAEDQAAERAILAVERLRADIGIPRRLRDLGVRQSQLHEMAEKAIAIRRVIRVNPRPVTVEDLESILLAAY
jgi:alcohol dehydrogenase class IV